MEMDKDKNDEHWAIVDVNALSSHLAEEEFKNVVKGIPVGNLYKSEIIQRGGEMRLETDLNAYFSTLFWNLKDRYKSLIYEFSKK